MENSLGNAKSNNISEYDKEAVFQSGLTCDSGIDVGYESGFSNYSSIDERNISVGYVSHEPLRSCEPISEEKDLENKEPVEELPSDCQVDFRTFCYPNPEGDTQLHLAIIEENFELSLYIISIMPSSDYLNIQNDKYFHTPLHLAVITNQPMVVRALVLKGASLSVRDRSGNTPVHLACSRGYEQCLIELTRPITVEESQSVFGKGSNNSGIGTRSSFNAAMKNYEGETCLHMAALSCNNSRIHIIDYLVKHFAADINSQEGKCGYTVLHLAVKSRDLDLLQYLIRHPQLYIDMPSYNHSTALSLANSLGLKAVSNLLVTHGATTFVEKAEDDMMTDFEDLVISGQS